ncbi:putative membrane protein [Propionispora sp. 2/2-37]|uniref:transcriptional regulator GutM n=1 Tax=Propionispora sp. 2/2-37 TaxID=1677858 RepID=UPI0006BB7D7A|nr:transcriptional regulator GutM [Propionispora sp. 2/2-37]CUH95537.1 putative membrane protein [Propionispora sp. 2/2-37]
MIFIALLVILLLQAIATYIQIQQYKQAVRRLRKLGNVGIGSKKGRLTPGNIVVIACNSAGVITGGEVLEGYTVFNGFREVRGIIGKTIYELRSEYLALPVKKQKAYKAHMQALDALDMRLNPTEV